MSINTLTEREVEAMSYNDLIGIVGEKNKVPGGINTLLDITNTINFNSNKRILEIGTSTGATAIDLVTLTGCHVVGIDLNEHSLSQAKSMANDYKVSSNINFVRMNAEKLKFDNNTFDVVFCGNVTSYISKKKDALNEYNRVLKIGGFLIAVPMYYIEKPSKNLLKKVGSAMNTTFEINKKNDWLKFFSIKNMNLIKVRDYRFNAVTENEITRYCDLIFENPELKNVSERIYHKLYKKYKDYLVLFNTNLSLMGYSCFIFRKDLQDIDPELFGGFEI